MHNPRGVTSGLKHDEPGDNHAGERPRHNSTKYTETVN